jgi:hypothetical protein
MSKELESNTTLSHYRIVSKLGAGAMIGGVSESGLRLCRLCVFARTGVFQDLFRAKTQSPAKTPTRSGG